MWKIKEIFKVLIGEEFFWVIIEEMPGSVHLHQHTKPRDCHSENTDSTSKKVPSQDLNIPFSSQNILSHLVKEKSTEINHPSQIKRNFWQHSKKISRHRHQ